MDAHSLLIILSGGLAGAILTLGVQSFVRYRNRPRLGISFYADDPGCTVNTPGYLVNGDGALATDGDGNPRIVQQRYLRIKIRNFGRSFARDVIAYVTRISYRPVDGQEQVFAEEVFDLKLALTGKQSVFNLAPDSHRFVDLVHSQQERNQAVGLGFDFVIGAVRLGLLGFGVGQYEMRMFVAADNGQSVSDTLRFSWDGTLNGLTIQL
jgi:hypothetical protein